jgi:putative spermidine/putrescine transport system substrate-binding protein
MSVRLLPALAIASGLLFGPSDANARPVGGNTILAQVPGTVLAQALRLAFATLPAASVPAVNFAPWAGSLAALQQRVASADPGPDLLLMPDADLLAACRQGLLIPLDWTALGDRASLPEASECGLPAFDEASVLAWDETRDHTPPEWPDFWDVARYPGKRGLPRRARGTLEVALMADGIAARDIYRVLGSADGVARAFRKLDQLRPYTVWWTDGEKAMKALQSGSVMMTLAPATNIAGPAGAKAPAFGQQWTGGLIEMLGWAVPVGAPDPHAATEVLRLGRDPARQAAVTSLVPVVGAGSAAVGVLPADALARAGGTMDRFRHLFRIDDLFWLNHPDLENRFDSWLASSH